MNKPVKLSERELENLKFAYPELSDFELSHFDIMRSDVQRLLQEIQILRRENTELKTNGEKHETNH